MTCIVRSGGTYDQYERLQKAYGHRMPVIWDRRRARNPHTTTSSETASSASIPNRRQKPPPSWTVLGFVVVDSSGLT